MAKQDYPWISIEHYTTHTINGKAFEVYLYSTHQDAYYDVFDPDGYCINLGSPFYEPPTHEQITEIAHAH